MTVNRKDRKARLIAFYLPQFHPIPENDEWWGRGFTEWRKVAGARPLFRGHEQPHLPADLGFYDLRVPEARAAQADLAREHGIEGFCYWHYWFGGKRLLERPFNEVLKSGEPEFPFCLGWANESWTGVWHGARDRILMEQTYPGKQDEESHFRALLGAFQDPRYLTIEGRPVFYVYRPRNLPDPRRFTEHWQELAVRSGLKGIYFIGEDLEMNWDPRRDGFDASVPHSPGFTFRRMIISHKEPVRLALRLKYYYLNRYIGRPNILRYEEYVERSCPALSADFTQYPSVLPNWDNTPRSGARGYVLTGSNPELFRLQLRKAMAQVAGRPHDNRVVFVKSWNEWAEGNYLEPDAKFGRAWLEACSDEVTGAC